MAFIAGTKRQADTNFKYGTSEDGINFIDGTNFEACTGLKVKAGTNLKVCAAFKAGTKLKTGTTDFIKTVNRWHH